MIPRALNAALATAALSAAFAACSKPAEPGTTGAAPAAAPASPAVDIEAEAEKAAAAIDESNADEELERVKSEVESE